MSTGQSRDFGGRVTGHRRQCFRLPYARCARHVGRQSRDGEEKKMAPWAPRLMLPLRERLHLGDVPKDRLCFGKNAYLAFHQARMGPSIAYEATREMFESYPMEIRGWLVAKGGLENMPWRGYWTMPARDLWAMGYRRCD
jgi:hypothetical protein